MDRFVDLSVFDLLYSFTVGVPLTQLMAGFLTISSRVAEKSSRRCEGPPRPVATTGAGDPMVQDSADYLRSSSTECLRFQS